MKTHAILTLAWLAIFGAFLSFSSPAVAASDPLIIQARDQLHQALNADGIDDKKAHLKSAIDLLIQSPAVFHGQRARAIQYVKSAIAEMDQGGPNNKASDYIYKALDELHDIS